MAKSQPKAALKTYKREGQVTAAGGLQNFFLRNVPLWNPPAWQEADYWRRFVEKQSIAAICRDTIANYLNSLDWAIIARDSEQRDELKGVIKHYTKLFERGNAYYYDIDFTSHVEWFVKELETLPFGMASELGRIDDNPKGRVVWIRPLDGGTLAPTLNFDFPIVQSAPNNYLQPVYLPKEFVSRVYLSPRTELRREGWGYAPPERIWRSIEMLRSGDDYYAQLLLNTPEAGILDLGDMEKNTAEDWVNSLRDLMYGINPLKIPVLYEHTTQTKWIPFGKPPSEILYNEVTLKYAAILCAGYGLTLSDIGFPSSSNGGETLAGTIRMERVGKSSGKALAKKKFEVYANKIVDPRVKFMFIDYDDERNVSKGRARLASAQAGQIWVDKKIFKPSEIRRQNLADGLFSIDVPEDIDPNDPEFQVNQVNTPIGGSKGKTLGNPKNPSQGGQGEIIPQQVVQRNMASAEVGVSKAVYGTNDILNTLMQTVKGNLSPEEIEIWEEYVDGYLTDKSDIEEDDLKSVLNDICSKSQAIIESQGWIEEISKAISDKIIQVQVAFEVDRANYRSSQESEENFIIGKSDSPAIEVNREDISSEVIARASELHGVIRKSLSLLIAKYGVMVSKSYLLSGKLEVDATEHVNENIHISREISKDVLQNFSRIVHSVYETGCKYLQEIQDAS